MLSFLQRIILVFLLIGGTTAFAQKRIYRYPDVSGDKIVFSFADNLWLVNKTGGQAVRISSPAGPELFPRFSPDGKTLAFSANYDGNMDIYTIDVNGGVPRRITHHGMSEIVQDWYPDGEHLFFASSMHSGKQRFNQFYKIKATGSLPEQLPITIAEFGSLSPDGQKMAYTYKSRVFRTWKRYRGGWSADIYVFDLQSREAENITSNDANDELPMWHGSSIYYISDKGPEKRYNIWKYDTNTREHSQLTNFKDFDVHFPAIGPEELVFEAAGSIYLLDLATAEYKEVNISIVDDMESVKPRLVNVQDYLADVSISPDGQRVLAGARGEIFSLPAEKGVTIDLSRSSGTAERYPAWSPDGKNIAWWSDKSGEYELYLYNQVSGETKKVSNLGEGYRYHIYWSPDSKKVAFVDQTMQINVLDISSGKVTPAGKGRWMYQGSLDNFSVSWSPDSRWLTYSNGLDNRQQAIFLFDTRQSEIHQVTSGFYSDDSPVFSPDGKYLYFTTNRRFKPLYSNFDNSWIYTNSTQIGLIPLADTTASPLLPENDTVTVKTDEDEKKGDKKKEEDKDNKKGDKGEEGKKDEEGKDRTIIDLEGMENRVVILPVDAGNIGDLAAVEGKVIYMRYPNSGSEEDDAALYYFDLEEEKEVRIIGEVSFFQLSADGKKILTGKWQRMGVIDMGSGKSLDKTVPLSDMQMRLVPREEWQQVFTDAWRIERDFFYDPSMHGVDWEGLRKHYGQLIANACTRTDVNYIIGELIGELNASHTYRGGGDLESTAHVSVGYLGIDWAFENGAYRVKEIIRAAPWDTEVRSPLDIPGVKVEVGDYILAVNGVPLTTYSDPWGAFAGLAGETVELTVNSKPEEKGARKVYVETLRSETRLRNLAWIEKNRKYVEEASGGKIGYVYVPSTATDGQEELVRMFYAQTDKPGMIIDERFNNGGQIPDRFIELLNRPALAYWDVRDGKNWSWPPVAHFGPKAMLINGWSGSGGDAFPDYFRKAGLGPLIGTRTWGGLIGITGAPSLIDGGGVTAPTFRMYNPDGTWFAEGHGIEPDIEVNEDPTDLANGIDPQLKKAVEVVLEELKTAKPSYIAPPQPEKR
ncbi:tricorn protease [Anseongella ginsenosidimutans]|uniref:Tricorn protease homolog n=1 Tax=Anseongella ginsenosidimutans TaxID=496056 RepID=A0A4V6NZ59_9SPHI|nr:S41 family peptidase [Anseongella ginsenosidimutans]QEC50954.1 peptidase S41 [Anseongella ginsenosidimutans]TCS90403.1 tricorn protease [Anseongella ginsenosidimutans]